MKTAPPPRSRRGLAVLALAMVAGAGAPLAAAVPSMIASAVPPPEPEIHRTLMIACPDLNRRELGEPSRPWLSRCGLPR